MDNIKTVDATLEMFLIIISEAYSYGIHEKIKMKYSCMLKKLHKTLM